MDEIHIVSVTDGSAINQNALKLMFKSLILHSSHLPPACVLCPTNTLSFKLSKWLKDRDIDIYSYPLDTSDDPYKVKFLLKTFLEEQRIASTDILYLDPDHLILSAIMLPAPADSSLLVSSEVTSIFPTAAKSDQLSNVPIHNNTSLIFGNQRSWGRVVQAWTEEYELLNPSVCTRFREEIAFCSASAKHAINLVPVETKIQSHFQSFHSGCQFFHYGGDSRNAQSIKQCLAQEEEIEARLNGLRNTVKDAVPVKIIAEMLAVWSYGE